MTDNDEQLLALAAQRAAQRPGFMSHVFSRYAEMEKLREQDLLETLNCSRFGFHRIALCRVPDTASPDFAARLRRIAATGGASVERLAHVVRSVKILGEALSTGAAGDASSAFHWAAVTGNPLAQPAFFMAARDVETGEAEAAPAEDAVNEAGEKAGEEEGGGDATR